MPPRLAGIGGHHSAVAIKDEWLTPPDILSALGSFDLDPCAPVNRPWDIAAEHYTIEDDGLDLPWNGRVWLNPPYGKQAEIWMERLATHGDGIALLFARTETQWFFTTVWERASALLFLRGRITFFLRDGTRSKTGHNSGGPSVLIAYGKRNAEILANCGLDGAFVEGWVCQ